MIDASLLDLLTSVDVLKYLNKATICGLLVPVDEVNGKYKFANEGVLRSVYAIIPQVELETFHLSIGRKLVREVSEDQLNEYLSVILLQFKRGMVRMTHEKERISIAALVLKASEHAVQLASFTVAAESLDFAIALLPDRCWRCDYDISLALYSRAAEVAYTVGAHTRVAQLVDVILSEARVLDHKLPAYCTKINSLSAKAKLDEAIDLGLDVLRQLNEPMRAHPNVSYIIREYVRMRCFMRNKRIGNLRRIETMVDHRKAAAMQVINLMLVPIRVGRPSLVPVVIFRMLRLTVTHGLCALSSVAFALYGVFLTVYVNQYSDGVQYGNLSLDLLERFGTKQWLPRIHAIVYGILYGWSKDLSLILEALQRGYEVGIESGDVEFALLNANMKSTYMYFRGDPLPIVKKELDRFTDEIVKLNQSSMLIVHMAQKYTAMMETNSLATFNNAVERDTSLFFGGTHQVSGHIHKYLLVFNTLVLSYIWRDYDCAAAAAETIDWTKFPLISIDLSLPFMIEAPARLAYSKQTAKNRREALTVARRRLSRLKRYAKCKHRIFLGIKVFMEAEVAAFKGDFDVADEKYFAYVALFERTRMPIQHGIACERAAIFMLEHGSHESAKFYLSEARRVFEEWGAMGKSDALSVEISELFGRSAVE